MSLILEALRRSEAERRRGAPPNLLDPGEPRPPRRASAWPVALAGLLGGLLIAGAAAWWWRGEHRERGGDAARPVAPAASAPPPWVAAERDAIPTAAYSAAPSTTPAPVTAPRPSPAAVAAPTPSPTRVPAPPIAPTPSTADEATPVPLDALGIAVPPTAPSGPPAVTAAGDAATGPREGDLALGELIGGTRDALPPLRVSMHVYADDPTRRFAIVDGQRLREGDPIGAGAQLVEIRRDGLRVAWQGRTLWVAR